MFAGRQGLIRRVVTVIGLTAALLSTGGVALAQQVPPPGVIPAPPSVPPVSLPPEAAPAGEAASVPAAVACSIPGGIVSILRFGIVAAGLTGQVDVDAASPWFAPFYSACLAFPVPTEPTQCDVDRTLKENGFGSNGLPITVYFPDPVGMLVTPVEVAERVVAENGAALPASPAATVSGPLGCEKLQPYGATGAGQLPVPELPVPGATPTSATAAGAPSAATSGGSTVGGAAGVAGSPGGGVGTAAPGVGQATSDQLALSPLPTARRTPPATGNTYLQNLVAVIAAVIGLITLGGMALSRREAARAVPPGS